VQGLNIEWRLPAEDEEGYCSLSSSVIASATSEAPTSPCSESAEACHGNRRGIPDHGIPDYGASDEGQHCLDAEMMPGTL
jgi:hypothetical protein